MTNPRPGGQVLEAGRKIRREEGEDTAADAVIVSFALFFFSFFLLQLITRHDYNDKPVGLWMI